MFPIALATAVLLLLIPAASEAKTLRGSSHAEVLRGSAHADVIKGRGGNDRLVGRAGNDRLYGGRGADRFSCGPGATPCTPTSATSSAAASPPTARSCAACPPRPSRRRQRVEKPAGCKYVTKPVLVLRGGEYVFEQQVVVDCPAGTPATSADPPVTPASRWEPILPGYWFQYEDFPALCRFRADHTGVRKTYPTGNLSFGTPYGFSW